MPLEAIVFDAYGTLFDVHSVSERCEEIWPRKGAAVSQLWRSKQLEYTWLRSLMRRYENFETITADALRHACAALQLRCDEAQLAHLMHAYRHLKTFPEVTAVLAAFNGRKRAILSNGSPEMLGALVSASGLAGEFDVSSASMHWKSTSPIRASTSWLSTRSASWPAGSASYRPTAGTPAARRVSASTPGGSIEAERRLTRSAPNPRISWALWPIYPPECPPTNDYFLARRAFCGKRFLRASSSTSVLKTCWVLMASARWAAGRALISSSRRLTLGSLS